MTARANFAYVGVIVSVAVAVVSVAWARTDLQGTAADRRVDALFSAWTHDTPGCAAAVGVKGRPCSPGPTGWPISSTAFANTPDTIFEAGSVSKQFTAAAVLLLARDGKLSLDDPVRKYIPELPDYGVAADDPPHADAHQRAARLGRGGRASPAGRARRASTRTRTCSTSSRGRQALNFTPGTKWSYSNTGYNLAAIIVSRVSGCRFAEFTRQRIFAPLGMAHTSWRDDLHADRASTARSPTAAQTDGYHQDMPFENVYGNGGLLTTVGDLLQVERELRAVHESAMRRFVAEEQTPGHFNDGRAARLCARVCTCEPYSGVREVQPQRIDGRISRVPDAAIRSSTSR